MYETFPLGDYVIHYFMERIQRGIDITKGPSIKTRYVPWVKYKLDDGDVITYHYSNEYLSTSMYTTFFSEKKALKKLKKAIQIFEKTVAIFDKKKTTTTYTKRYGK